MSKIRSAHELSNALDDAIAWRIKEIYDISFAVGKSSGLRDGTLLRAGVALLYAHWEGFVVEAARKYVDFVGSQGIPLRDLSECFLGLSLRRTIQDAYQSGRAQAYVALGSFVQNELGSRAQPTLGSLISGKSNLSSSVFESIAVAIGIDLTAYKPKFNLIDAELLKRRNSIAHGEYLPVDARQFVGIREQVVELMRSVKKDIEDAASSQAYRRTV